MELGYGRTCEERETGLYRRTGLTKDWSQRHYFPAYIIRSEELVILGRVLLYGQGEGKLRYAPSSLLARDCSAGWQVRN